MDNYLNRQIGNLTELINGVLIEEQWAEIHGYDGLYQISNFGRVKSMGNGLHSYPIAIKKQVLGDVGYPTVGLSKNGVNKTHRTHRLVATAFIPNPFNKIQVNHKKAIKIDNRAWELEWATPKEDSIHAYSIGVLKLPSTSFNKGVDNHNSKPVSQYDSNGVFIKNYASQIEAYQLTKVKNISLACKGIYKTAGGFQWRFKGDKKGVLKNASKYNTGRYHHNSKPIYQYTIDGVFIKKWENARMAALELCIVVGSIGKAAKGKLNTAGGFKWEFV